MISVGSNPTWRAMEYRVNGKTYSLSYMELKDHYTTFCEMSDEEFKTKLSSAAHLACIICFLKEIPTSSCLSDEGIVHQLIHLMDTNDPIINLQQIRELFKKDLELV